LAESGRGAQGEIDGKSVRVGNRSFLEAAGIPMEALADEADRLATERKSVVWLGIDDTLVGILGLADVIREESRAAVAWLGRMGREVALVTGITRRPRRLSPGNWASTRCRPGPFPATKPLWSPGSRRPGRSSPWSRRHQ